MERTQRSIGAGIIIIFHIVGFWGFQSTETRTLFEDLVPMNLLLSLAVLLYFHSPKSLNWLFFAISTIFLGYIIEVVGVQTGLVFGDYAYDTALGPKIWGVPPMIGINWLMLVYSVGVITQGLPINNLVKVLLGTLLMVVIDLLIEPVAISFHFWHWESQDVPIQNYVSWGIVAAALLTLFHYIPGNAKNPVAGIFYATQLIFFGAFALIS